MTDEHYIVVGFDAVMKEVGKPNRKVYVPVAGPLEYVVKVTKTEAIVYLTYAHKEDVTITGAVWNDADGGMVTIWMQDADT